jgi:hypothetical protein
MDAATGCPGLSRVGKGGGSGRQVAKSCVPTSTIMRKRDGVECSRVQFFLGWWLLFSHEWWGHIHYGLYDSPGICYWREPIIFIILGRNRWPVEPRTLDPDITFHDNLLFCLFFNMEESFMIICCFEFFSNMEERCI